MAGLIFFGIMILGEVMLWGIFAALSSILRSHSPSFISILKGFIERLILFFGLIMGYPNMIIFFGAIKLGTRLHEDNQNKISNDYFLIGNMISVGAVLGYQYVYFQFMNVL